MAAVLTGVACAQHSGDIPPAARKFQGEQVLFIQVVSGSEFLLDQALNQPAFPGCVLFDSEPPHNRENFQFPSDFDTAVVIDELGFVAGYGSEERSVRSVLNHEWETGLLEAPRQPRQPRRFDPAEGLKPSYEVHVAASRDQWPLLAGQIGANRDVLKFGTLKTIIPDLWHTSMARIEFPEKLEEGHYDVIAHIPVADPDLLLQLVRQAVENEFGVRVEKEEQMQHIYVLKAAGNTSQQLQPDASGQEMWGGGQGSINGTARTMQDIARVFQGLLNVPVVDETGRKGKYTYLASSKLSEADAAFDMAHQLGLELKPAERPIEMLVVRKVQ